jgi:hypothetical protein
MAFVTEPFSGATFFTDIRTKMTDRGLFAGKDGPLRYVVMDASFYRFQTWLRPATKKFTVGATNAQAGDPNLRVISSGSFAHDYDYNNPAPQNWEGEVIDAHAVQAGTPASLPDHRYIGQWDGQGEVAVDMDRGDPSSVASPDFDDAIGGLLPIIKKGIKFAGARQEHSVTGELQVAGSNAIAGWEKEGRYVGKMIAGVHRQASVFFILAQEHLSPFNPAGAGLSITDVIGRLHGMGVDDAVMGDGSDSVTLVVDGAIELDPRFYKDNSNTTGFSFRLKKFTLPTGVASGSKLIRYPGTTDPAFPDGTGLRDQQGGISLDGGDIVLGLNSLGYVIGGLAGAALQTALGVTTMPLELRATGKSMLATAQTFSGTNVTASLRHVGDKTSAGQIRGTMTFTTPNGTVVFDVTWPVEAEDA